MLSPNKFIPYRVVRSHDHADSSGTQNNRPVAPHDARALRLPNNLCKQQPYGIYAAGGRGAQPPPNKNQLLEAQKISLIRNMIKEEMLGQRKLFKKMLAQTKESIAASVEQSLGTEMQAMVKREVEQRSSKTSSAIKEQLAKFKEELEGSLKASIQEDRNARQSLNKSLQTQLKSCSPAQKGLEKIQKSVFQKMQQEQHRIDRQLKHINSRLTAITVLRQGSPAKETTNLRKLDRLENNIVDIMTKLQHYNEVLLELSQSSKIADQKLVVAMPAVKVLEEQMENLDNQQRVMKSQFRKILDEIDEKAQQSYRLEKTLGEKLSLIEQWLTKKVGKSNQDIFESVNDLQQKTAIHGKVLAKVGQDLDTLKMQLDAGSSSLSKFNDKFGQIEKQQDDNYEKLNTDLQQNFNLFKQTMENYIGELVQNYNVNFEELEATTAELQDFNVDLVDLVKTMYLKLRHVIHLQETSKESVASLQEAAAFTTRQIRDHHTKFSEITEKEFELQHQLRNLKEKLDCIEEAHSHRHIQHTGTNLEGSRLKFEEDCLPTSRTRKFQDGGSYYGYSSPIILRSLSMDVEESLLGD